MSVLVPNQIKFERMEEYKAHVLNHCSESIIPLLSSFYDNSVKKVKQSSIGDIEEDLLGVVELLARRTENEILSHEEVQAIHAILTEIEDFYNIVYNTSLEESKKDFSLKIAWLKRVILDNSLIRAENEKKEKIFASYKSLYTLIHLIINYYEEIMPTFENKWTLFMIIIKRSIKANQPLSEEEKMKLLLTFLNNNLDRCCAIHNSLINQFYNESFNRETIEKINKSNNDDIFKLIHHNNETVIEKR